MEQKENNNPIMEHNFTQLQPLPSCCTAAVFFLSPLLTEARTVAFRYQAENKPFRSAQDSFNSFTPHKISNQLIHIAVLYMPVIL